MNLEDESHLSAYLDDELDPPDRLAVEWSVESSPPLSDQLRSIAQARDLVAGLARPEIPRDLAPSVGARIASNRRRARLRSFARPAHAALVLSSFTALAASLIFAIVRIYPSLHVTPEHPAIVAQTEPSQAPRTHTADSIEPKSDPVPVPTSSKLALEPTVLPSPTKPHVDLPKVASVPVSEVPGGSSERRLVDGILGRSHVRGIVIVTDVIDASEQVKNLILQDPRETPDFGRISIRQEILIDHEGIREAEVFAVPIDERGRRSFVERLQKIFPDLIEEGRSKPGLVSQLTKVGQVAVFRGVEAAPLGDPPGDLPGLIAHREPNFPALLLEPDRSPLDLGRSKPGVQVDRPEVLPPGGDPGPRLASLSPDFVGPPDSEGKAPPRPGERVTLLVWVTRPSPR